MLRHDASGAHRRAKAVQGLVLQGILAAVIILFAFLSRGSPRAFGLSLWTAIVPVGFAAAYWSAYRRGEAARAGRAWTPQMEAAEAKRLVRFLGLTVVAWIAGAAAILLLV